MSDAPPPLFGGNFVAFTTFGFKLILRGCFFNPILNDITAVRSTITWFYTELYFKSIELLWRHISKEQQCDTAFMVSAGKVCLIILHVYYML
jgi:hypothetical protein